MSKHQRMAERNQVAGAFGRCDAGDARNLQRIPLRILRQLLEHLGCDTYEGVRARRAARLLLGGNIHHARAARRIVMREFFHFERIRMSSPRAYSARSGSATRNALARVSEGISPDPCQFTGDTSLPSALKWAGKNRVNPGRCRNSAVSRA